MFGSIGLMDKNREIRERERQQIQEDVNMTEGQHRLKDQ